MTKKGEGTQATQEVKETKTFETLQDYKDAGYTVGDMVGMSNPPTYFLTSPEGDTIRFRPKMKVNPNIPKPKRFKKDGGMIKGYKKGGEVKGYMGGGEVHMDNSPNSGMITQRGWGASRKT